MVKLMPILFKPLSLADIIVTVRLTISHNMFGLGAAFEECENKEMFVKRCRQFVAGYNSDLLDDQFDDYFFSETLHSVLVTPSSHLFKNRNDIHANDDPIIIHFGKYCLFREIFELYKQKRISIPSQEIDELKEWFLFTKNNLDLEFDKICNVKKYKFKIWKSPMQINCKN